MVVGAPGPRPKRGTVRFGVVCVKNAFGVRQVDVCESQKIDKFVISLLNSTIFAAKHNDPKRIRNCERPFSLNSLRSSALDTQVHRLECLSGSRIVIRSGFEATRILAWRDLRLWATSGGCGQPPKNIMINEDIEGRVSSGLQTIRRRDSAACEARETKPAHKTLQQYGLQGQNSTTASRRRSVVDRPHQSHST